MPDPEDYVDAPSGSPRAKLERQRQGKSQYGAIPAAVKKDPVGVAQLLAAAFVPEAAMPKGSGAAKAVIAGEQKGPGFTDVINKLGDATSSLHNGIKGFGGLLRGAQEMGDRKAKGYKNGGVPHKEPPEGSPAGKKHEKGESKAVEAKEKKLPGAAMGMIAPKTSSQLLQSGFDTTFPNGLLSTDVSGLTPQEAPPSANPVGNAAGAVPLVPEMEFPKQIMGMRGGTGPGGSSATGTFGRVGSPDTPEFNSVYNPTRYLEQLRTGQTNSLGYSKNPLTGMKSGGYIRRGLDSMANGGFVTMKGARRGAKGVAGKRMPKNGVMMAAKGAVVGRPMSEVVPQVPNGETVDGPPPSQPGSMPKGPVKKSGSFKGKSNKLGHGGRAAQLKAQGVPGGVIGKLARQAHAAPGQKNYHGGK